MRANQGKSAANRIASLFVFAFGVAFVASACDGGNEGDRCNPDLSHNDCGAGLTCQTPSTCVENYCCPADPTTSSNNYCNGKNCPPAADADTSGGDDASDDASAEDASAD
jgi:hypothetical protein